MKRFLRWAGYLFGGLIGLLLVATALIYFLSERALKHIYPVPALALTLPTDPAEIAEGERLATLLDCFGGCHGKQGEGRVMFDQPLVGRVVAPNLHAAARRYSAPELAAIIRHGVLPDGRSLMIMPTEAFHALIDRDLARIVAFLKSTPPTEGPGAQVVLGPLGRVGVTLGKFKPAAELVAQAGEPPKAADGVAAQGRYLARITCAPCHGTDLRGTSNPEFTAPALQMVRAYSMQTFSNLMRSGVSAGGKEIVFMKHLAALADDEVASLYAYLHGLPTAQ